MKPTTSDARGIATGGRLSFRASQAANAQTNSPPAATATRPAKHPQEQSSIPSNAPPATTTQTTGEASRDPMVKQMNEKEKGKVESEGK